MLLNSWVSFIYIAAVPICLLDLNPWRTSCICRLARRRVLISASTKLHRVSNRLMPLVSVLPFGISTRTAHPNFSGISPLRHMLWTRSNRHIYCSLCGGVFDLSPGYASCHHCLKCSVRRWVYPPSLCGRRRHTAASTSASDGILLFNLTGSTCVARVRPVECGSSF